MRMSSQPPHPYKAGCSCNQTMSGPLLPACVKLYQLSCSNCDTVYRVAAITRAVHLWPGKHMVIRHTPVLTPRSGSETSAA